MEKFKIADHSGLTIETSNYFKPKNTSDLTDFLTKNPTLKLRIGGGLTGVSGGAVPYENEHFIDLKTFNSLKWEDKNTGIVHAEAGVTMKQIQEFVETEGWFFPIMPGMPFATIGGLVACNGGGPMSLKYGKIGNYVLGLELVIANGEQINVGGTLTKNSEGVDFTKLFIGSEGTLGIITKVFLQCVPKIQEIYYYRIAADSFEEIVDLIPTLLKHSPYLVEVAEKEALKFTSNVNENVIWLAVNSPLQLSIGTNYRITKHNQEIMNERFQIGHSLQKYKPFIDLDVSFPINTSKNAVIELKKLLVNYQLENIVFGHGGNGNWHIHVFFNNDHDKWEQCQQKFDEIIIENKGVISGEHGIGRIHKERFVRKSQPFQKEIYTALKQQLDPNNRFPSLY
jgi:glycolate oxidase